MQKNIQTDEPIISCPFVCHAEFELFSDWGIRSDGFGEQESLFR